MATISNGKWNYSVFTWYDYNLQISSFSKILDNKTIENKGITGDLFSENELYIENTEENKTKYDKDEYVIGYLLLSGEKYYGYVKKSMLVFIGGEATPPQDLTFPTIKEQTEKTEQLKTTLDNKVESIGDIINTKIREKPTTLTQVEDVLNRKMLGVGSLISLKQIDLDTKYTPIKKITYGKTTSDMGGKKVVKIDNFYYVVYYSNVAYNNNKTSKYLPVIYKFSENGNFISKHIYTEATKYSSSSTGCLQAFTYKNKIIMLGDHQGELHIYDTVTNTFKVYTHYWIHREDAYSYTIIQNMTVNGNICYIATNKNMVAFNIDTELFVWTTTDLFRYDYYAFLMKCDSYGNIRTLPSQTMRDNKYAGRYRCFNSNGDLIAQGEVDNNAGSMGNDNYKLMELVGDKMYTLKRPSQLQCYTMLSDGTISLDWSRTTIDEYTGFSYISEKPVGFYSKELNSIIIRSTYRGSYSNPRDISFFECFDDKGNSIKADIDISTIPEEYQMFFKDNNKYYAMQDGTVMAVTYNIEEGFEVAFAFINFPTFKYILKYV